MTTNDAALIAGVTPTTIRRWINANPQRLVAGTERLLTKQATRSER